MYKTGDKASQTGHYQFVRYVDGTTIPSPTANERLIPLQHGETFPPIKLSNKGAYWQLIAKSALRQT